MESVNQSLVTREGLLQKKKVIEQRLTEVDIGATQTLEHPGPLEQAGATALQ